MTPGLPFRDPETRQHPDPQGLIRRALTGALLLLALPAGADEALRSLPDLYSTSNAKRSDAYFAYIRCAALVTAQQSWHAQHGSGGRVSRQRQADARSAIDRAQRYKSDHPEPGIGYPEAVSRDLTRDADRYLARFAANVAAGQHPWDGDDLIAGDIQYCDLFAQYRLRNTPKKP